MAGRGTARAKVLRQELAGVFMDWPGGPGSRRGEWEMCSERCQVGAGLGLVGPL